MRPSSAAVATRRPPSAARPNSASSSREIVFCADSQAVLTGRIRPASAATLLSATFAAADSHATEVNVDVEGFRELIDSLGAWSQRNKIARALAADAPVVAAAARAVRAPSPPSPATIKAEGIAARRAQRASQARSPLRSPGVGGGGGLSASLVLSASRSMRPATASATIRFLRNGLGGGGGGGDGSLINNNNNTTTSPQGKNLLIRPVSAFPRVPATLTTTTTTTVISSPPRSPRSSSSSLHHTTTTTTTTTQPPPPLSLLSSPPPNLKSPKPFDWTVYLRSGRSKSSTRALRAPLLDAPLPLQTSRGGEESFTGSVGVGDSSSKLVASSSPSTTKRLIRPQPPVIAAALRLQRARVLAAAAAAVRTTPADVRAAEFGYYTRAERDSGLARTSGVLLKTKDERAETGARAAAGEAGYGWRASENISSRAPPAVPGPLEKADALAASVSAERARRSSVAQRSAALRAEERREGERALAREALGPRAVVAQKARSVAALLTAALICASGVAAVERNLSDRAEVAKKSLAATMVKAWMQLRLAMRRQHRRREARKIVRRWAINVATARIVRKRKKAGTVVAAFFVAASELGFGLSGVRAVFEYRRVVRALRAVRAALHRVRASRVARIKVTSVAWAKAEAGARLRAASRLILEAEAFAGDARSGSASGSNSIVMSAGLGPREAAVFNARVERSGGGGLGGMAGLALVARRGRMLERRKLVGGNHVANVVARISAADESEWAAAAMGLAGSVVPGGGGVGGGVRRKMSPSSHRVGPHPTTAVDDDFDSGAAMTAAAGMGGGVNTSVEQDVVEAYFTVPEDVGGSGASAPLRLAAATAHAKKVAAEAHAARSTSPVHLLRAARAAGLDLTGGGSGWRTLAVARWCLPGVPELSREVGTESLVAAAGLRRRALARAWVRRVTALAPMARDRTAAMYASQAAAAASGRRLREGVKAWPSPWPPPRPYLEYLPTASDLRGAVDAALCARWRVGGTVAMGKGEGYFSH
jgi:hypothetical protein